MYSSLILLIAEGDPRLQSFSGGFRKHRAQVDSGDVVLFLLGAALVLAVVWLLARWSERRVRNNSSLGLFLTLANAHGVNWSDRWLLWRIARARRIAEPSLVFLDPRLTSPHSSYHLAPGSAARLTELRRRFFEGIDDPSSEVVDAEMGERRVVSAEGFPEQGPLESAEALTEALNALLRQNVQDQPIAKPELHGEASGEQAQGPAAPTAEFPAAEAPVLDPWLGNAWERSDADK